MDFYPVVRFNGLKLPNEFADSSTKNYLQIKPDNIFQDSRLTKDTNCDAFSTLKAQNQIPCCCGTYYFEIDLLTENPLGYIGLGIANATIDEGTQLGKGNGSAGLYLINRHTVNLWIADKEYPITITEKMRVQHLGFGINFMENYVFCTVNGVLLLHMKELPPRDKFPLDNLYPAVSSQSPQCSFAVNMGHDVTKPFSFNFQYYKRNQLKKKRNQCLSQEYSPKLAFVTVCNLVSDYLLHHGYAEAWEALNKYDDSQSKGQSLETIKNRRLIQKCILDQDYLGAIMNINQHFPDFFLQNPIYKFILKCRHFINLINSLEEDICFKKNRILILHFLCLNYNQLSNKNKAKYTPHDFYKISFKLLEGLFFDIRYTEVEDKSKNKPIHLACKNGRIDIVKLLISKKCDLKVGNINAEQPIHFASKTNYVIIIKLLYFNNCDLDAQSKFKYTPLHEACWLQSKETVEYLLSKNCNIEATTSRFYKPIHMACLNKGSADIVKLLLLKGCEIEDEDNDGYKPIHLASLCGDTETVKLLLSQNCQLHTKDKCFDMTPIELACWKNFPDIVEILFQKCNDYNRLIHLAAESCTEVLRSLLSKNFNIEAENLERQRPIHLACEEGNIDSIKLLLSTNCDIESKDSFGKTPLHYVCEIWDNLKLIPCLKLLLSQNCDIEAEDFNGRRLIHLACSKGQINIVRLLLWKNCCIEAKDSMGKSPIHYACEKCEENKIPIIKLLLSRNCDIEAADNEKNRPIHIAQGSKFEDATKLLISNNCDLEIMNSEGERPIHTAISQNDITLVKLLLSKGCNTNSTDSNRNTPIMLACSKGNADITKLLLSNHCNLNIENKPRQHQLLVSIISLNLEQFLQPNESISVKKIQTFVLECFSENNEVIEKYFANVLSNLKNIKLKKTFNQLYRLMSKHISIKPSDNHLLKPGSSSQGHQEGYEKCTKSKSILYTKICSICYSKSIDRVNECGHTFCGECLNLGEECYACSANIQNDRCLIQH